MEYEHNYVMMHLKDNAMRVNHAIKVFTAISECKLHLINK